MLGPLTGYYAWRVLVIHGQLWAHPDDSMPAGRHNDRDFQAGHASPILVTRSTAKDLVNVFRLNAKTWLLQWIAAV
jgi:hypothetical protein